MEQASPQNALKKYWPLSAELRRQHPIKALDSFIAATAMLTRTTLATRNVRDFRQIPSLFVLEI